MRSSLPSSVALVLRVLVRVAGAAPVAGAGVEPAVGPELELAAVVVRRSRGAGSRSPCGASPHWRSRVGAGAELVDLDVPGAVRVVGVEEVVAAVVGVEGDREQAALAPVETRPWMSRNGWPRTLPS